MRYRPGIVQPVLLFELDQTGDLHACMLRSCPQIEFDNLISWSLLLPCNLWAQGNSLHHLSPPKTKKVLDKEEVVALVYMFSKAGHCADLTSTSSTVNVIKSCCIPHCKTWDSWKSISRERNTAPAVILYKRFPLGEKPRPRARSVIGVR